MKKHILGVLSKHRTLLVTLAKYGLGLGLLAFVIACYWHVPSADGEELGLSSVMHRTVKLGPLALATTIFVASLLLTFVRWYLLVWAQGLPFTLPNAMRLGMIGAYLNSFLPGSIGGDIVKAAFIARGQSRRTVAVATVMLDRAIGLCGLFWLVTLLGGFFWAGGWLESLVSTREGQTTLQTILVGAFALTAGSIAFWLLLGFLPPHRAEIFAGRLSRIPRVGHSLAEFWRAVWMYRCRGRVVAVALLMSVIGHVGFVLTFYFSSLTLSPAKDIPSLGAHFLAVPVGMAIQAGFPAPGGVGGGEVAFGFLYGLLGSRPALGVLASLVQRVIGWAIGLVGYLVYLRMRPSLPSTETEAAGEGAAASENVLATVDRQSSGKDAMVDHPPASPLRGKYLVQNRFLNRFLSFTDRLLGTLPSPHASISVPRRILLANAAHLGDVLLSLAVLQALRDHFPDVRIGFLSGTWARCLLEHHPLIDWIHHVDHWKLNRSQLTFWQKLARYHHTRRKALGQIRANRYDVAIDLYSFFPNTIPLLWQAGIPCRVGYTSGGFGPLLTHPLDWSLQERHVTDYHSDLLGCLGISARRLSTWGTLPGDPNEQLPEPVREHFRRGGIPSTGFLVFHLGAGLALKEWPLPCWRELAQRLVGEGHALAFTGSSKREKKQSEWVSAGLPRCLNLCGRLTWQEFVATVRQARLLVGVDSVAGHVAAAVGTPCVVVSSGITSSIHWAPRGPACRVLVHPVPCAPCYRSRGCAEMECVRGVPVEQVQDAIQELLRCTLSQSA